MKAGCGDGNNTGDSTSVRPQQLTPRFACISEETKLYGFASPRLPPSSECAVTELS